MTRTMRLTDPVTHCVETFTFDPARHRVAVGCVEHYDYCPAVYDLVDVPGESLDDLDFGLAVPRALWVRGSSNAYLPARAAAIDLARRLGLRCED
jgi:hypothetical protein